MKKQYFHFYWSNILLYLSVLLLKYLICVLCPPLNISKLRPMLSMSNAEMLINPFMTSRLDYCNALLGGCSARLINKLQMVQNAAARVLTRTRKYDHISPVMSTLHWIPFKHRIDFKILLITYKALNGLAPKYLGELLSHYSPLRPLRSQNSGHLIIPRISKSPAGESRSKKSKSLSIYCRNSGTIYLTLFGRHTNSVSLNLD